MTSTHDSLRVWIAVASAVASNVTMSLICTGPGAGRFVAWTAAAMVAPAAKPKAVRRFMELPLELLSESNRHLPVAKGQKRSLLRNLRMREESWRPDFLFGGDGTALAAQDRGLKICLLWKQGDDLGDLDH